MFKAAGVSPVVVTVLVWVAVLVLVIVSVTVSVSPPQAAKSTVEPMAAPPTTSPASLRNSLLEMAPDSFFFPSIILLYDLLFDLYLLIIW
jgi:hypothetical protein